MASLPHPNSGIDCGPCPPNVLRFSGGPQRLLHCSHRTPSAGCADSARARRPERLDEHQEQEQNRAGKRHTIDSQSWT